MSTSDQKTEALTQLKACFPEGSAVTTLIRCEVASCAAEFFHVPARAYPGLCLDHADEAARGGLLFLDRSTGGTCWYPAAS